MDHQQVLHQLSLLHQTRILSILETLTAEQKQRLLDQLTKIDFDLLQQQMDLLKNSQPSDPFLEPFTTFSYAGNEADRLRGQKMLAEGLAGCLIVAGGQGTRLRFEGPKGMFLITPIRHKSLYQFFAEKTIAASKQAKKELPLAIMTSPQNHQETVAFFEGHKYFGLSQDQVFFFQQQMLPLLDTEGQIFLETKEHLAEGPDGNGGALHHFYHSGIWQKWHARGIHYVNFILIDNPLADPFDAELLGYHERKKSEIVIKSISRSDPLENVGILTKNKGRMTVIEYSEMPEALRTAKNTNGSLTYPCANLSLFSFHMDFVQKIADKNAYPLPLHKAFKSVKYLNPEGVSLQADKPMAWKFERFIFDLLPQAATVETLLYKREDCFAPLKNFSGNDSLKTVREALQRKDRQVLKNLLDQSLINEPLEIAQDFYYPTPELIAKWRQKPLPESGYIEA